MSRHATALNPDRSLQRLAARYLVQDDVLPIDGTGFRPGECLPAANLPIHPPTALKVWRRHGNTVEETPMAPVTRIPMIPGGRL